MKITVKWWCDTCEMYTPDQIDEHEDRHYQETRKKYRAWLFEQEDPAGDSSGASFDEWGGR